MIGQKPILILGAGATKDSGGPMTDEILPGMLDLPPATYNLENDIDDVKRFLQEAFRMEVPIHKGSVFPPLPLVLSLLDTAVDRNESLVSGWSPNRLREVRRSLEFIISAVIEYSLQQGNFHNHHQLLFRIFGDQPPRVVSMNYDVIIDNAIAERSPGDFTLPNYGADLLPNVFRQRAPHGTLHKIHGSLHFLYCVNCKSLDLGLTDQGYAYKALQILFPEDLRGLRQQQEQRVCSRCGAQEFQPILITPTHLKDYRNAHIARIWYEAEKAMQEADSAIFVGYSLPSDDIEVAYLLKKGIGHIEPNRITVVDRSPELGDTHNRYRAMFGQLEWRPHTMSDWLFNQPDEIRA